MRARSLVPICLALLVGCAASDGGGAAQDAGAAGVVDAAGEDAHSTDGVQGDAGRIDAGSADSTGDAADSGMAGTATDVTPDPKDAADGMPDSGSAPDAADAADSTPDGGDTADAGPSCSPPDPAPGVGPSGYPMDGWGWASHGVILEDPDAGANEGLLAPSLVERDGTLHLFYTRKAGALHRIWHAESTDGATWTGAAEATGLGDDPVLAYPAVLVEDGRFRMWVGSGTFDLAESEDGVAWTIVAESVLRPSDVGGFGALSLLYPTVAPTPDGYVMWFTGYDGAQLRIGRATSPDGVAWTVSPAEPVLSPGAATGFDNKAVAGPHALRVGDQWLLWYGGYDTSKTNPGPYRVGVATSTDGVAWQKAGVSLDLPAAGPDAWSTRDPAVLPRPDGWLMIYAGLGTDQRYRLLRATSAVCP